MSLPYAGDAQVPVQQQPQPPARPQQPMNSDNFLPANLKKEQVNAWHQRYLQLKSQGATEATSQELAQLSRALRMAQLHAQQQAQQQAQHQAQQQAQQQQPTQQQRAQQGQGEQQVPASSVSQDMSSVPSQTGSDILDTLGSPLPKDQKLTLRNQIAAFKYVTRNMPIPSQVQQALFATQEPDSVQQSPVAEAMAAAKETLAAADKEEPVPEINITSPWTYFTKPITFNAHAQRESRVLVPAIMPVGMDLVAWTAEREQEIQNRIALRIAELEQLPSNITGFEGVRDPEADAMMPGPPKDPSALKTKALIELMKLRLLPKQRALRQSMVRSMVDLNTLTTSADRASFRRMKKMTLDDSRLTERIESEQRLDREKREKQKQLDYLQGIVAHGQEIMQAQRSKVSRQQKLGKAVLALHSNIEKEEQRRLERVAKERLQALRADDEEAYLKLIDQAKDTRITHLLRQTNTYLDSLSAKVKAQQMEAARMDPGLMAEDFEDDEEEDEEAAASKKQDYYGVAHRVREEVTKQPNILVGGHLKDYQIKGLQWMVSLYNNHLNGILADEMGLGKTVQTIALITYLIEVKKQNGPYLVLVPLSTLTNWTNEFERWAPSVTKVVYKGVPQARKAIYANHIRPGNFQVLLTTFEYVIKDRPQLSKIKWLHLIIDEGHRMKNTNSKLTLTLTTYYSMRYRLILTGTPLQNNLPELWALLNFVLPKIFNSVKSFDEWFNAPFANTGGQDTMQLSEEETLLIIRRLHKVLRPFLLRRLKKDVESELPDKVEKVVKCRMSGLQLKLYEQLKKGGIMYVNGEKGKGMKGLQNIMMQLRKVCNHPFVFDEVEEAISPVRDVTTDLLWRVSGKFELLDRILPKLKRTGHRVLMFFQMTTVMTIMEDFLNHRGMKYMRLDGSSKADDRQTMLTEFNAPNSDCFIFILSTRAGGLGLNLQTADTVVIFDSDWNPHQDLQAQDRAHRIGQKKEVRIFRLITQNSVEEAILARAQYKLELDGKVIQAGKFDNKSTAEEQEAYLRKIFEQDQNEVDEDADMFDDDVLNEIVARNDNELQIFKEMDEERKMREPYGEDKELGRLMAVEELPEEYQQDYVVMEADGKLATGRGARERQAVFYDDGLTEEQWLDAMDNENIDVDNVIRQKRERKAARDATKLQKPTETSPAPSLPESEAPKKSTKKGKKAGANKRSREDAEEEGSPERKRGRQGDMLSKEERASMRKTLQGAYDAVISLQDEGYDLAEVFLVKPNKKQYPDYYQIIKEPIALDMIQKRIKGTAYNSLDDFVTDVQLMFRNARTYNEDGSFVYTAANKLEDAFEEKLQELAPDYEYNPNDDYADSGDDMAA
ncbi:hypothetical protein SAICODRAFT_63654 [Saitoella complicata NRRL Y-17804]|uniref:uncharacterized protein n=1 Tax=Saitoella complicata (strain BCRC 22490 / CBS 7301 / JCM 7358 / NBRC 10748 / NRRL Y-17804) TaxID=698492 RepID=UPI000868121B|nr:uncharacterized protein SAICODRAFT_63654 [Saitoella complicata NRRL Y-17804]ODQ55638.1 hypothetical protein SAICODRAFT_63654 [Saitoella complicata NRRL Y-17804]